MVVVDVPCDAFSSPPALTRHCCPRPKTADRKRYGYIKAGYRSSGRAALRKVLEAFYKMKMFPAPFYVVDGSTLRMDKAIRCSGSFVKFEHSDPAKAR